jgi:hypothetical protein
MRGGHPVVARDALDRPSKSRFSRLGAFGPARFELSRTNANGKTAVRRTGDYPGRAPLPIDLKGDEIRSITNSRETQRPQRRRSMRFSPHLSIEIRGWISEKF